MYNLIKLESSDNIKKYIKENYENIISSTNFFCIITLLLLIQVGSILITNDIIVLKDFSSYLIILGIVLLIIYILYKVNNFKFSKFEIMILILCVLSSLSLINTIDINTALFGKINRYEGLFVILTYYLIALDTSLLKNDIYKKIIIGFIILIGFINAFYGFMQTDLITNFILVKDKWSYARGFNGNSMYYASLLSICYPLVLGLFIKNNNKKTDILTFILVIIFTLGILNSGAMATFLSSIILLIFIFIKGICNKNIKEIIKIIFVILTFIISSVYLSNKNDNLKKDINEFYNESASVVGDRKVEDSFGTGRIYIWKNTIIKMKDNLIFGVGIDNFRLAFDSKLIDLKNGLIVDKAHNEYLQKYFCEGIFSGTLYLIIVLYVFFKNIKRNNKMWYMLLIAFISFSIQSFFNISVTRVNPIYFIIMGLLMSKEASTKSLIN